VDELVFRSATDLAASMRVGDLSAREVVEAHLAQIDRVNPAVNAIVTLDPERAMAAAEAADARQASGAELGVLHGLPIAHKDLVPTAGMRTTWGSPVFADFVPDEDALLVERIRDAGALLIGKTNTPELGAGSQTFNSVFGATRNPYDPDRTCGGSSGGAAVALAAGMLPIADGSDLGGSLRNPAAFCNVVGFRPSPGVVPSWPKLAALSHLSTDGPMGRSVGDAALLLSAMAGPDPRSPIALERDGRMFLGDLSREMSGVRVAWSRDLGGLPIESDITSTLEDSRRVFVDLGCEVVDAEPDLRDAREIFQVYRAWQFEVGYADLHEEHAAQLKETVRWNMTEARRRPLTDHTRATRLLTELYHRVRLFFGGFDVLACPATQVVPFPVEVEYPEAIGAVEMETYVDWMRACTDISVTGCPAISVPAGFTNEGLPVGLQLVGPHRGDLGLLQIAAAFEDATRFGMQRPAVGL
jgi:amidase